MEGVCSMEVKKRLFSGIQPTGIITLGNYLGAVKSWTELQDEYDCIFSIVDMHAITVKQEPAELRKNTLQLLAFYLAAGIDPDKNILFVQSHVPCHAELQWVLDTMTYIGELSRMTQFKDKSKKQEGGNVNMGLMNYPVLMAADILLYLADVVPVGEDQRQHLELTRDIAMRFNRRYSPTFTVPEGFFPKHGARIMSLASPEQKMSKSDANVNGFVTVMDDKDTILRKFRRAVTDSENRVAMGEHKKGINNLITIYCCMTGKTPDSVEKQFEGVGYAEFKDAVGESVANVLTPLQQRQRELIADKDHLSRILREGSEKAYAIARKTLDKVYRKIGFYRG